MTMDYRNIFESALNDAHEIARVPDDDTFIRIVKERSGKMKKTDRKFRKPAVIAASVAAAAALTFSVGAVLNWDIVSLFMNVTSVERAEHSELSENILREYYENEEFKVHGVSAETEYDILQKISHEIDRDFTVAGHDVHITGYAYDGNWFALLYEVKFAEGVPESIGDRFPIAITTASYDSRFKVRGWQTVITQITENTIKYRTYSDFALPHELSIRLYLTEEKDRYDAYMNGMHYPTGQFVDIDLIGTSEYSYSKDMYRTVNTENGVLNIKNINISPFGVVIRGTSSSRNIFDAKPSLLAVFKDGTVTDIAARGSNSAILDDGSYQFFASYTSHGILLDAREITEIRIGDTSIPIN